MADEARVIVSLSIVGDNLQYRPQQVSFQADVAGRKGPVPGALTIAPAGTDIDLSELAIPALCRISHLGTANYVTYGIYDPELDRYFPLGELLPGEVYIIRLAQDLHQEYGGTTSGTGTSGPATNRLRFKAIGGSVNVLVEAFEK